MGLNLVNTAFAGSFSSSSLLYGRVLGRMAPHMALFVGAGLAIGAIFTHAVLGGLLALLVWVGLQLRQLARLHAWLVAPNRHVLPDTRSEEHTSELQSLMRSSYAVFCMKKKQI